MNIQNPSPLHLNLGSSCYLIDNFLNIDNNVLALISPFKCILNPLIGNGGRQWIKTFKERSPNAKFLRFDCSKALPFANETVDHILASHFIEHHYLGDARRIMRDWWRILKPGATLHVLVPDLISLVSQYSHHHGSPEAAGDFFKSLTVSPLRTPKMFNSLITLITNGDTDHRWMYDIHSLRHELETAGFEVLSEIRGPSAEWRRNDPHQVNLVAVKVS